MKVSTVLITGASGFVGKNLLPYLKQNLFETFTLGRSNSDYTWDKVNSINGEFKAVIHLAGKAHDVKGLAADSEYTNINFGLTKTAFEVFNNSNSEIFIYFSSVKAVASKVEGVLTEEDLFEVDNPYGASKRKAEEYLLSQKLKENQRLYILRPCMIHGPGNKGNLNLLYQMAKKRIPFPFTAFSNERSLLGIDNLHEIVKGLIETKPESGIYNLSDDGYISTNSIYKTMGEVLSKKLILLKIPKAFINLIGKVGDISPLPIDSLKIMKLTENYRVSNGKIKKALNWEKLPYSLKDNLFKTLKSFN